MNTNKLLSGEYIPVPEASWSFRHLAGRIISLMPSEGEKILFVEAEEVGGPPDSLVPAIFRYKAARVSRADPIIVLDSDEEEDVPSFILMVTVKDDVVQELDEEEELEVRLNRSPKYKKIKKYPSKKPQKRTSQPPSSEEEEEEEEEEEKESCQSCPSSAALHVKRPRRVKQYAPRKIHAATEAPGTSSGLVSEDNPRTQRLPEGEGGPSVHATQRSRNRPDPLFAILERQAAATEDVATGIHSIAAALLQIASEGRINRVVRQLVPEDKRRH